MKHCLRTLVIVLFLWGGQALSQPRFSITSIQNFPVAPADTAYEGVSYDSITVNITNLGNVAFQGEFDILLSAAPAVTDTLLLDSNGISVINPGDTVQFRVLPYTFTTTNFDGGDNIIVVWPQARQAPVGTISDTLTLDVYFVMIQGITGVPENPISLYPNPAIQYLAWELPDKNSLKRVRIYTLSGKIVYASSSATERVNVRDWLPGVYLVDIELKNGNHLSRKVMKH